MVVKKEPILGRLSGFLQSLYIQFCKIDDTPQKISGGIALGVFCGVFPGTGPVASLFLAFLFKVNKAAALIGSTLTNTWLSIPVFLSAIRVGALMTGVSYEDFSQAWALVIKDFHLASIFKLSFSSVVLPVLLGYLVVALGIGGLTYLLAFVVIKFARK